MNNLWSVILVAFVGVVGGASLLFSINTSVMNAAMPFVQKAQEISANQTALSHKVDQLQTTINQLTKDLEPLTTMAKGAGNRPAPQANAPRAPEIDPNKVYDIPVGNSIIVGKKDAPVTIVKFTDLQCPFCSRFYPPVKEVLKNYPDQVRLIIKHFPLPFHPNAKPAAKIALAANEQGKYIEMIEELLNGSADVSEAKVKEYAQKVGIKYDKLMADAKANDAKYEAVIAEDMKLVSEVNVQGTPSFYINGKTTMARDYASFKVEIDKILAEKK